MKIKCVRQLASEYEKIMHNHLSKWDPVESWQKKVAKGEFESQCYEICLWLAMKFHWKFLLIRQYYLRINVLVLVHT